MGSFQSIVLAILTISFLTFVALFGHALRYVTGVVVFDPCRAETDRSSSL